MNYETGFWAIAQTGGFGEISIFTILFVAAIVIWTLFWKGLALWTSARNNHKAWFIVLLVLNTAGILEIIYYFFFRKQDSKGQQLLRDYFPKKEANELKESL